MKMNAEKKQKARGEFRDLDALAEKGRQLHSNAIFEFFPELFKRINTSNKNVTIAKQNQRLVDSH